MKPDEMCFDCMTVHPYESMMHLYEAFVVLHRCFYFVTLVFNFYFFFRLMNASRIHKNFRIVVCSAALSFEIMGGTRLAVHVLLESAVAATDRYVVNLICLVLSNIHMISIFGSVLCMNMIAVEQHLATLWVQDYERRSGIAGVILLGIVFVQCVPLALALNWYLTKDEFELHTATRSCLAMDLHWELSLMGFCTCTVTCTVAAVWLEMLKRKNRQLTAQRINLTSLSARYQQTENSLMNDAIAPSMVGYMVLTFWGFILSFSRKYFVDQYGENFIMNRFATDLGYASFDAYSLFHMICFLYGNTYLRAQVRKDLQRVFCIAAGDVSAQKVSSVHLNPEEAGEHYFQTLKKSWQSER